MDRVRRLVVALLILAVAGLVALVVTVRPGLRDHADSIDASWRPLVASLDARYRTLVAFRDAMKTAGLGDREVTQDLTRALDRWTIASTGTDASAQVASANQLEAIAARAGALVQRSARLARIPALGAAYAAFTNLHVPTKLLDAYNHDVVGYQGARDGFWSRIVARLDGYPMRPTLQLVA